MADCQDTEKAEDSMKHYKFDGQSYIYKDPTTNVTYRFDRDKNEWMVKDTEETKIKDSDDNEVKAQEGVFGFENDTHTYTDPNDGSVYFWDKEKNAWFPKVRCVFHKKYFNELFVIYIAHNALSLKYFQIIIFQVDEDFMARYQMSYGFTDASKVETNTVQQSQAQAKIDKEKKKMEAKRKAQEPPTWFEVDEAHNTAIYVSGLPLDITMDELTELFNKCGLIARDERGKDKIKLYKDTNGQPKGDALCIYIKVSDYLFGFCCQLFYK